MNVDFRRIYLMHGMKRSGNHAISNWLLPQLDCAYFNNVIPLGGILRGRPIPAPRPFEDWRREREQCSGTPFTSALVTLEDHDLRLTPFLDMRNVASCNILVLRNPLQLFSSRLRKAFRVDMPAYPRSNDLVMQRATTLWKQHARCFLGDSANYPGRVAILFDAWFVDIDYRAAISSALGIPFDDRGFNRVSPEGGGSSFDSTRFDGRSHLMSVTNRVSALEPHERELLDEIFRDQEMSELGDAISEADPYRQLVLDTDFKGIR